MKKSFILHLDSLIILEEMTDEQAGQFIKIIYHYQKTGELLPMDFGIKMAITPFINQFKRDNELWENELKNKSLSGKLGNLKRWNDDLYKQVIDNKITIDAAEEIAESRKNRTRDNSDEKNRDISQKSLVNVNVSVNDNVNVNESNLSPSGDLPQKKNIDFLNFENYIKKTNFVKGIKIQVDEKQYMKLRENFEVAEIFDCIDRMDNSKSIKNKTSVYLSVLFYLKEIYGKPGIKNVMQNFKDEYKNFIQLITGGEAQPRWDNYETQALARIIEYLKENSKEKNYESALQSWIYILKKWKTLDAFMQARIKVVEIDKDLVKIINYIKNGNNKTNQGYNGHNADHIQATSQRKDF